MSLPTLLGVTIEHLRGSVTPFKLPFERGKRLTIIYGENGSGKSTVADAFDLLGNGKVGSLEPRGLGITRQYWPSLGRTAADVSVTLETAAGSCRLTLGKNDVVISNQALRPKVEVLRRSQILQLVEAKPAERYTAISRFIDVSGIEDSESTLRALIRDKEGEFKDASLRVSENRDSIERFWAEAGKPASNAIAWAKREVLKDQADLDKRRIAIDRLIGLWDKVASHPPKLSVLATQLNEARKAQLQAQDQLDELNNSLASDHRELLDLLKAAQRHFVNHPNPAACPLCESDEKVADLVSEVNRRIQSQRSSSEREAAKTALAAKNAAVQQSQQRLDDALKAAADDSAALVAYCVGSEFPPDIGKPTLPVPTDLAGWAAWIDSSQSQRSQWAGASEACVADKKFIGTLSASLDALSGNEKRAKELEALLPRLKNTLDLIVRERKKFTDGVLTAISTRVGELYETIHPGEGLNKIALALDSTKRASLEIAAEFGGKSDAPPQAYFSDSHLDTLGLCAFLALAERDDPEKKLLVLDDVLASVDEPHVERSIEMLYEAASRFRHCIVTTHYGPWRHKYRWGWLKNGQCQFVELARWSLHNGMSWSRSIPESERLRGMLIDASPDHQAICAKAGVVLEAILDFLTQIYECSVPRKASGAYTLGELLPAIDSKLRKSLRVEHRHEDSTGAVTYLSRALEPHLVELSRIAQVRNVMGCHFNALSFDLLDSDALSFGAEVLALTDALIDHEAGWPKNPTSGSYWATAGETRRLHPLKKPS